MRVNYWAYIHSSSRHMVIKGETQSYGGGMSDLAFAKEELAHGNSFILAISRHYFECDADMFPPASEVSGYFMKEFLAQGFVPRNDKWYLSNEIAEVPERNRFNTMDL